jgi:UDP-2-acetamido-2-deoxy-ribo-hexuluronate aminotransferase
MSKLNIPFIDLNKQYLEIKPNIQKRINQVLEHGQYIMGPEVYELEEKLSNYVGVKYCISASSGTDSLLIAMMALEIGVGDEVITTPFSFIAVAEMIALLGAKPIFVDVNPCTYNLDPNKIEAAISSKTKAIIPVNLYGQCADYDAINAIANKYNLPVIEDAAQSFGATYKGKKSCSLSTVGSTSFFPTKPLGAYGDGGALFTNDEKLAKAMRKIRLHGQEKRYSHSTIGINGRLDTIQAAILLAKLERFDWELERRIKIGNQYSKLIKNKNDCNSNNIITTPYIESFNNSVYAQYTVLVKNRDKIQKKLNDEGIPTAVHYPMPIHLQTSIINLKLGILSYPNSEILSQQVLSLPMGADLDNITQEIVVNFLHDANTT